MILAVQSSPEEAAPAHRPHQIQARTSLWQNVVRPLANLKLAIAELVAIGLSSGLGTIVEQNKPHDYYVENYPSGARLLSHDIIELFMLNNIYQAPWFLALLGLLAASLVACTHTNQWPQLRSVNKWKFKKSQESISRLPISLQIDRADLASFGELLASHQYQVFNQKGALYAFRGVSGKVAPIGVHISLVLILTGMAIGSLCSFSGVLLAPEGSSTALDSVMKPKSVFARPPHGAAAVLHVDDFDLKYRSDGSVQQFVTRVTLSGGDGMGQTRFDVQRSLYVNKPLRFQGVTAYQTDWSLSSVEGSASKVSDPSSVHNFKLLLAPLKGKRWATAIPMPKSNQRSGGAIVLIAEDPRTVVLYDSGGNFAGVQRPGSTKPVQVDGLVVDIKHVTAATGLELKADPSIPIVYAGFGGLCLTTVLSCLPYSQVWAVQKQDGIILGGRTNRNAAGFESEVETMCDAVPIVADEEAMVADL